MSNESCKINDRRDGQYILGSGSRCGSCGKVEVKLLEWKDCDSIPKKIEFLFGKVVNTLVSSGKSLCEKTVSIFKFDKVAKFFFDFLKVCYNKLSICIESISNHASKMFEAISNNSYVKAAKTHLFTYILDPISNGISKVFKFVFKTVIWENICLPLYNRIIKPCTSGLCKATERTVISEDTSSSFCIKISKKLEIIITPIGHGLKTLANWTIVPLYNRLISPVLKGIGDSIHALVSGIYRKNESAPRSSAPLDDDGSDDEDVVARASTELASETESV